MWMTSCTGSAQRILGDLKKSVSRVENEKPNERGRLSGSQRPDEFARYGRRKILGCRWKSQNRKNVYLSPYVEEPLNSKVIKSFVPELRSRKCFSCFGIPLFSVYMLWIFYVRFTHIRIMGMVHYNSKLHLMVLFQCWRREKRGVFFIAITPSCPVGWSCRIHWQHLCTEVRLPPKVTWICH